MREADFDEFGAMLDAVCSLLSRGAYAPSAANTALFFRALARYDLAQVRAGFDAHVTDPQRGRFVPVPADIIAQLDGLAADDGRPGADEAWATALRAADERQTLVWTEDMAQAWSIARTVFEAGDEVGARVAFRDAYNRIVDAARRDRRPVRWNASLGFDQGTRSDAIREAATLGRIPATDALLLEGQALTIEELGRCAPQHALDALDRLRERIALRGAEESQDSRGKRDTALLRGQSAALVANYGNRQQQREHEEQSE